MNTPALVTRSSSNNLPQWSPAAPGYLSLETGAIGGGGTSEQSRQASQLGTAFRKYWWVLLLIWAVIAIPSSILAYEYIPPKYVAKGAVQVSPIVTNAIDPNIKETNPFFTEYLRTQAEMMKNPFVLQRAAADVRLKKYEWFHQLADQVRYLDENVVVMSSSEDIYVSMTYRDAEAATAIVDSVIDAYFRSRNELDEQSIDKSLKILKDLQATTDKSLSESKATLTRLETDGGTTWSDDDRKVVTEVIGKVRQTLGELQGKQIELTAASNALKMRQPPQEDLYKASIPADNDPDMSRWLAERTRVQMADSQAASRKMMPQHPDRIEFRKQLADLDKKIQTRRAEIQETAWTNFKAKFDLDTADMLKKSETDLATVTEQIGSLQKHVDEQVEIARQLGNKTQPILALKEQITDLKNASNRYSDRIAQIENQTRAPGHVTLVGPTVQPKTPTVNKWPTVAAAANGGGLFIGFLVLVILMKLRNKIDHADDLPENFQPLVVGTVSHAAMAGGAVQGGMRRRILGEEMQLLHANLLPPGKSERRVMMVTSPTPANGKTSIASHLALSLAKSGLEVLLIDADMRKRDLTTMFDLGFRPGLSDLLQGNAPDLVRPMELLPNLRVMGAGSKLERNPVELLQRKHFHESLALLHDNFDCIVIDTPPTLVVADARLIARSCDEVLCVVRANLTSPKEVNQTLEALTRITGKAPKIVVNGVAHRQSYYKYKYDYTKDSAVDDSAVGAGSPGSIG